MCSIFRILRYLSILPDIIDKSVRVCLHKLASEGEEIGLPKQESTVYTVEREFLSNISVEELLRRIFMSQISSDTEGEGEQHGSGSV